MTGGDHPIEYKGKEAFWVRNHIRLLVCGNPDWLVPAGMKERRFGIFGVGEDHIEDYPYFAAIDGQMDNGGREALLDYLLNLDISNVNLRAIPKTAALLDQKLQSLDPIPRWWWTTLRDGRLSGGCIEQNVCPVSQLYKHYLDHTAMIHHRSQRSMEVELGIKLRNLLPVSKTKKPLLRRYRSSYRTVFEGALHTGHVYQLPGHSYARRHTATNV